MTTTESPSVLWRKSTYSNAESNCVEVASGQSGAVAVRDSKDSEGPKLAFTPDKWRAFTRTLKNRK